MTKKRIILTSLVGTAALGTLAVSLTLAWYGASNLLSVNTFDMSIAGNTTLKLSLKRDLDSFKEEITDKEFKDEEKQFLFEPVSSMCKDTWMNEQKDMPVFYDCSSYLTPSSGVPDLKVATTGYFSKKIYLLSSLDYYVSLDVDDNKTFFNNNSDANFTRAQSIYTDIKKKNPDTTVTITEIQDSLDNLKNCLRASILVNIEGNYKYYIINPWKGDGETTRYGGLLDNDANGYYDTYTYKERQDNGQLKDFEKETVYGEVNDRSLVVYNDPVRSSPSQGEYYPSSYDPYYGNSFLGENKDTAYTFNETASYANGMRFAEEESFSLEDLRKNESLIKIPCYKNVITEIVVSVYLEGWDRDCINATMGASFETKISFKLNGGIV